jgi:hypothetical protein
MMSFSCAHLTFSTKAVAPEKLQGEAELALFFWGTGRLVTGPISHKQQFFFFFFLAFWSKQCDQSLFHLLGFSRHTAAAVFLEAAYVLSA